MYKIISGGGKMMRYEEKKQGRICIFLAYMLCFTGIVSSLGAIFNDLLPGISFNIGLLYILYFILLTWVIVDNCAKVSGSTILIVLVITALFLSVLVFHSQNMKYMWTTASDLLENPTYIFVFYALIGYFVSRRLKNITVFISILEKFAVFTVMVLAFRFFVGVIFKSTVPEYMTFSYNLLFPTTFLLLFSIRDFKWYRVVTAILGSVLIFIAGCRGALLSLIISTLLYVFFFGKIPRKNKYRVTAVFMILLIIVVFFYEPILVLLNGKLSGIGINSRTIAMLLTSTFSDDSGRENIIEHVVKNFNVFGYGLWGDRVLLNGMYAHNMVIELLCDFGLIVGSILLVVFISILVKGLKYSDEQMSVILCALVSVGVIKLLFSGSFLNQEPGVYVLIGLCINSIKDFVREQRLREK